MSNPNFQVKLGSAGATALKADTIPEPVADPNGRPGWSYTKVASGEGGGGVGANDKFNYYFYSGLYETMKLKDVLSMSFLGSIDNWTGVANQAPFFMIYTKMTGSNDAGSWYHSKHAYVLNTATNLIRTGEKCQFYCLSKPVHKHADARLVEFRTRIDTGTYDPEGEVLAMTLHSDSAALAPSVYCEELQANMHSFTRHGGATSIQLKLIV